VPWGTPKAAKYALPENVALDSRQFEVDPDDSDKQAAAAKAKAKARGKGKGGAKGATPA
jgi:hypothetical protein